MASGASRKKKLRSKKKKKEMGAAQPPDSETPANGPHANGDAHCILDPAGIQEEEEERDSGSDRRRSDEEGEERMEEDHPSGSADVAVDPDLVSAVADGEEALPHLGDVTEVVMELEKEVEEVPAVPVVAVPVEELPVSEPQEVTIEFVNPEEEGGVVGGQDSIVEETPLMPEQAIEPAVEVVAGETAVAADPLEATKSREIAATSMVASVPSAEDRATWWNCCGLLDVFTGSMR